MATRRPLVLVSGVPHELPTGDTLVLDTLPVQTSAADRTSGRLALASYVQLLTNVNDIGVAGLAGFGVGVAPYVPSGFTPLPGHDTIGHDNYGNYRYLDGSLGVYVPVHWSRIGHAESLHYATYGLNAIDIAPYSAFASEEEANASGYILPRAFLDGGQVVQGVIVDKYLCSPSADGVTCGRSVYRGVPISLTTTTGYIRSQSMTGCSGIYADAITLARARGGTWQCTSVFIYSMLANLAQAHAQAATSGTDCAWYDSALTKNGPRGCDNNALGSSEESTLLWTTAGDSGDAKKPLTGSCATFAKSTHNGQNCGIADLGGAMFEVAIGVTTPGSSATDSSVAASGDLWVLKPSVSVVSLTAGWNAATDAWQSAANIGTLYDQAVGAMWWTNDELLTRFGNSTVQVFDPAATGLGYQRTALGIPKDATAVSGGGTNMFWADGLYKYWRANVALLVGGSWTTLSQAGPYCRNWANTRSNGWRGTSFRASTYVT